MPLAAHVAHRARGIGVKNVELVVRDQGLFHYGRIVASDCRVIDMAIERLVVGVDIALHDICAELPTTEVDRLARGRFEVRSCERRAKDGRAHRRGARRPAAPPMKIRLSMLENLSVMISDLPLGAEHPCNAWNTQSARS